MKRKTWIKHHKIFGLVLCFFLLMFCVSGIVLNHPKLFSSLDVSRKALPRNYEYRQWNGGLLRGTVAWHQKVLLYGYNGVWKTDSSGHKISDFNRGMPIGVDRRSIRRIVVMPQGTLFAASTYDLFRYRPHRGWTVIPLPIDIDERLSDIANQRDTLLITGRSHIFYSLPPYRTFHRLTLPASPDNDGHVSLFRTVWWLHSGELFGLTGKLIVDGIALVLIFLSLTGIMYWIVPRMTRHRYAALMKWLFVWHNKVGRLTIVLTLFLCFTGWLLRPPAMLAIITGRVPAVPFSVMDSPNAWYDKLRSLRFDIQSGDWLLYSSDGFYRMATLTASPRKLTGTPPVSVMGLNVQQQQANGTWLIGSFSGLYRWNRNTGQVNDWFGEDSSISQYGPPISNHPVSGFSNELCDGACVVDYRQGTPILPMPPTMKTLPMSLRNVCLEVHTGRIYTFFGRAGILYIFLIGLAIAWCLWTGWKLRRPLNSINSQFFRRRVMHIRNFISKFARNKF